MPQYMLLLGGVDKERKDASLESYKPIAQKYSEWTAQLIKSGRFKDANRLKDYQGRKLTIKGSEIIDGPFTETKESVGGYYIIEAKDYSEAVEIAKGCPILAYQKGFVEIREIQQQG